MNCFWEIIFFQVVAITNATSDEYRLDSKKMVIALVDMEWFFIPPQHFIRLCSACAQLWLDSIFYFASF
jgi:hypothetical protein